MTVLVDVLPVVPLPVVRVVVSVPGGRSWSLVGVTDEGEWPVASGVSSGVEVVTADPWAPVGVAVSYELRHGGLVESAGPVVRPFDGEHVLSDVSGRMVAEFRWLAGDGREGERRAHFSDVAGSPFSPARLDPVAGVGGGSLTAQTTGAHTATLRRLLASNRPLVLLHNRYRCEVPGCDTPAAQTIYVTSDRNDRSGRTDAAHRVWDLSYRLMPSGVVGGTVPVVTLGDVKSKFATLADVKAAVPKLSDLARGDWLFA